MTCNRKNWEVRGTIVHPRMAILADDVIKIWRYICSLKTKIGRYDCSSIKNFRNSA
jgi:hypothetical protein